MAPIEPASELTISNLSVANAEDGLALSSEAGWNQTKRDWAMMLQFGQGFGVRDAGQLIACSLAMPYPPQFGWLSMVLVSVPYRRRGLATCLLEHGIAHLKSLDLTPILDATSAGRALYQRLGFHDIEPISRWRGTGAGMRGSLSAAPIDLRVMQDADRVAFGADRGALIADLVARPDCLALVKPSGAFVVSRAGRTATQIGPLVAASAEDTTALLKQAMDQIAGPLLIDVPDRETGLAGLLKQRGFTVERSFTRMGLAPP